MLYDRTSPADKRRQLRDQLASGQLIRAVGAFSPLVARLVEELGFEVVYSSGAALSSDLGLPDVGLTTLDETTARAHAIARVTRLPTLVDADTGFGGPLQVARSVQELEDRGIAACHLEDQELPKRCGHLDGKRLVSRSTFARKIRAAVDARRDDELVVIARTDARGVEGLDAAIDRARAAVDAGADAVFPEALVDEAELEAFRAAIDVPLVANLTEFGKSPLLDTDTLAALGYNLVLYPVTAWRLALGAVERGLTALAEAGTQRGLIADMMTRERLYELVQYRSYGDFDRDLYDFAEPDLPR